MTNLAKVCLVFFSFLQTGKTLDHGISRCIIFFPMKNRSNMLNPYNHKKENVSQLQNFIFKFSYHFENVDIFLQSRTELFC
jgi:hypothetical protein